MPSRIDGLIPITVRNFGSVLVRQWFRWYGIVCHYTRDRGGGLAQARRKQSCVECGRVAESYLEQHGRNSKFLRFPRTAGRYYIPKENHFLYYTRNKIMRVQGTIRQ